MLKAFQDALTLLAHLDGGVLGIVWVSLQVSLTALLIGTLLGLPIGALSRQILEDSWKIHRDSFLSLRLPPLSRFKWLIWDCRFSLTIAILAGLARAISEVGAVMIVGGNIDHSTRTMTTAIALETSKGDLPLALALGIALLMIVLLANLFTFGVRQIAERRYG
ncbi:ABC transporter permease [Polynucleobacter necessarius]|uniref:ABC transporter permease n=1 Tax=Polynucleobacter necessarius TaxID=576610 RepID=UPI000FE1D7E7|nr:ABC transporter permease [Polynucleobacter necessarius]